MRFRSFLAKYSYDVHNPMVPGATSYALGRLTRVEVAGGSVQAFDTYDAQGRVTRSRQITAGTTYRFGSDAVPGYEYLLNGALTKQRYPSGREFSFSYNDLGQVTTVTGMKDTATTEYVKSAVYHPHGALQSWRLNGDNLRESYGYDPSRLQLQSIDVERCQDAVCSSPAELLHLGYGYGTANNGNPRDQVIRGPGGLNVKQVYEYDAWNRLKHFTEGPTGGSTALDESYCYDRHGNRAVLTRPGLGSMTPQVTTCDESSVLALFPGNRISGSAYDTGGELKNDGRSDLWFDIEDRLRKSQPPTGDPTTYEYDGNGRRISKTTGSSTTYFVYDAVGELNVEYSGTGGATGTQYLHADHLGSTRLITDGTNATKRLDYFPFGGELTASDTSYRSAGTLATTTVDPTQRFTGKERDAETGLDYFGARLYSGALGRFTIADPSPKGIALGDPQSWNLYAYTRNRPLANIDVNGNWSQAVHHDIVRFAFRGILSAGEIQILIDRQVAMDSDQSAGSSFMHAMGQPGESSATTLNRMWGFVADNAAVATKDARANGRLTRTGLIALGNAMHTLHDFTSPQHVTSAGVPIVWKGFLGENIHGLVHLFGEDSASDSWSGFGRAVRFSLAIFLQTTANQAGLKGLTSETLDRIASQAISEYVDYYFRTNTPLSERTHGAGYDERERGAARQCALGNPAACQ